MDTRWINVIGTLHKTPVLSKMRKTVLALSLYAAVEIYVEKYLLHEDFRFPAGIHTMLGVVLGMLIVFRTNTAYERWWEGRKLWGQLVNDSRNLALKLASLSPLPAEERYRFGLTISAFAGGLRDHLRGQADLEKLPAALQQEPRELAAHLPSYLVRLMLDQVREWQRQGKLDSIEVLYLDRQLSSFLDICGSCERIRNTPLNRSHTSFVRQCILFYLIMLPPGLDSTPWVVGIEALVSYFLLGVEQIASEIEEPFGYDPDDLPLDALCATVQVSMSTILPRPADPVEVAQEVPEVHAEVR